MRAAQTAQEAVEREHARFDNEYASIDDSIDRQQKLIRRMTESLVKEVVGTTMTEAKGLMVTMDHVKKMDTLASATAKLVQAQNALTKTAKDRAARMTPEQRREALVLAVASMPAEDRRAFLRAATDKHNELRRKSIDAGLEAPLPDGHDFLRLT